MSFRNRVKPEMDIEEFASEELINKVRSALIKLYDVELGWPDDYRRDRLLTELTRELVLSRM